MIDFIMGRIAYFVVGMLIVFYFMALAVVGLISPKTTDDLRFETQQWFKRLDVEDDDDY